jgi:signal transduction histidine kinase
VNSEYENIDASIDALAERIELAGIGLSVMREKIESIGDRLTILQMEVDLGEEDL